MSRIYCVVQDCHRTPIWQDGDDFLCERHMPEPGMRSWAEMKAEGIEVETFAEYAHEVRGFNDHDFESGDDDPLDYDPNF